MTDHHITPPPSLMRQWREQAPRFPEGDAGREERLIERSAQWGYDQRGKVNEAKLQQARDEELEACCEWLREAKNHGFGYGHGAELARKLRAARRPPPPSLKEQALEDFHWLVGRTLGRKDGNSSEFDERSNRILSALEALSND